MRPADPRVLTAVFAGGCAGALARAGVAELLPVEAGRWPWATLVVNVLGSFALGLLAARPGGTLRMPLLGAGFCGALTTFSALQLELLQLLDAGRAGVALVYAAVTLGAGVAAVRLGAGP